MSNQILDRRSNATLVAKAETTLMTLLPEVCPNLVITVKGVTMNMTQLAALLQSHVTGNDAVDELKRQTHQLVVSQDALLADVRLAVETLKGAVGGTFGLHSDQYDKLGFAPKQRTPLTADQKAAAKAKAAATRKAHGILGKKQRKAIKVPVDATTPATPTPTGNTPAPGSTTPSK